MTSITGSSDTAMRASIMRHHSALIALVAFAVSLAAACVPASRAQSGLATAELHSGAISVVAELAIGPAEQETGLMYRTSLADGKGMLFVYHDDRRLSFWMKNTLIPLSIAYISADGTIREIHDMEPESLAAINSDHFVRYALEVPQGWFSRVGLGVGDRFDLSKVPGL
jgi:uncharacterized membrane protein (UPF0127 family)